MEAGAGMKTDAQRGRCAAREGLRTRFMRTRMRTLALVLALAAAAAGCGGREDEAAVAPPADEPSPTPAAAPAPEATPEPSPEPTPPPSVHPLTGLPAETPAADRPFAVIVENSPSARPQSGLHLADIVYEVLAEGDITRFVAIFHSETAEEIGPVRSMRPYFVELGMAADAVLVHAGWSQEAMNLMAKHKWNHLDEVYGDHAYYWRDKSRKAPHNVYTSTELMRKGAEERKFRAEWNGFALTFAPSGASAPAGAGAPAETDARNGADAGAGGSARNGADAPANGSARNGADAPANGPARPGAEPAGSVPALKATIPYIGKYEVEYEYDKEGGVYLRTMAGKPHEDKNTGVRIKAANVLVVETKHRVVDSVGRREVDVKGPGQGYLLQGGIAVPIHWRLKDGAIRAYEDEAGTKEIPLLPGKTWVQIVPNAGKASFSG